MTMRFRMAATTTTSLIQDLMLITNHQSGSRSKICSYYQYRHDSQSQLDYR